jgi:hypothetical protein
VEPTDEAMDGAIRSGHLKLVKFLSRKRLDYSQAAIEHAAGGGHLEILKYLDGRAGYHDIGKALDYAASGLAYTMYPHRYAYESSLISGKSSNVGHLEVVRWLHETFPDIRCTTRAMDMAARNGNLDIVRFLHENRTEGCTTFAMDAAARSGYLDIVTFLHENRSEGCTKCAMNLAAGFGHLEVVKFLHLNRTEGCTSDAINDAARNGYLEVVQYLYENKLARNACVAMVEAASRGHLKILEYLHQHTAEAEFRSKYLLRAVQRAADRGHIHVLDWLHSHYNITGQRAVNQIFEAAVLHKNRKLISWQFNKLRRRNHDDYQKMVDFAIRKRRVDILQFLRAIRCKLPLVGIFKNTSSTIECTAQIISFLSWVYDQLPDNDKDTVHTIAKAANNYRIREWIEAKEYYSGRRVRRKLR